MAWNPFADDPLAGEIYLRLAEEAQKRLSTMMPRPASPESPPVLDRAVERVRQAYPQDMAGTSISMWPIVDYFTGSTLMGRTPSNPTGEIQLNPLYTTLIPQEGIEETIAHELEHVRQVRRGQAPELNTEYGKRPSEIEARAAEDRYNRLRGRPAYGFNITRYIDAFPPSRLDELRARLKALLEETLPPSQPISPK